MAERLNITVGTAGHVDHGKTALVMNLTGCDTDFLKEEKERGMSIDLGYAPFFFKEFEVGIVDVPGHENFIRTMVAGVTGIDAVMFVVAADDGVMPQTREHLDILSLLGVRAGLIVMTKTDRVTPDRVLEASQQIRDQVRGTFLESSVIVPASNVTGDGLGDLREHLARILLDIPRRDTGGPFRMPVDRTFAVKGFGTVVTGIPVSGAASLGDELEMIRQAGGEPERGRVRTVQVYQSQADWAQAGQCAALNIPQWKHDGIRRGDVVVTPGVFSRHEWVLCQLRVLPDERNVLRNGEKIRFHVGTADVTGSVYLLKTSRLTSGEEAVVQIRLDTPLVLGPRDHFIVRLQTPPRTVAGGLVLEGLPRRLKRTSEETLAYAEEKSEAVHDPVQSVELCLRRRGMDGATAMELAQETSMLAEDVEPCLAKLNAEAGGRSRFFHRETIQEAAEKILAAIEDYHKAEPQSPGVTKARAAEASRLPAACFEAALAALLADRRIDFSLADRRLSLPGWQPSLPEAIAPVCARVEALFLDRLFHPPDPSEAARELGVDGPTCGLAIKALKEFGRLVEAPGGIVFHSNAVREAAARATEHIKKEGLLESVDFKYQIGTTRKFALPLIDHLDAIGVTRRVGNTRYLNTKTTMTKRVP
ncbi:MAG: selenocysteine-specific translation elongation factor [Verrucomicrobiae bacterium]